MPLSSFKMLISKTLKALNPQQIDEICEFVGKEQMVDTEKWSLLAKAYFYYPGNQRDRDRNKSTQIYSIMSSGKKDKDG